ncbi:MAG: alpha/beta hydrolase-fold protein [Verrucomicrobiota bacterium]|nr:alpha/beta hydrolase-fold protein [Verrucomicrobiota bacterium]
MMRWLQILISVLLIVPVAAQDATKKKKKKERPPFKWVNKLPANAPKEVKHVTFRSPSMGVEVGCCIYLPPQYEAAKTKRFPVVYYLHGGRPGSEIKSVKLVPWIHAAMKEGRVAPAIYVFPNGGPVSHYNMGKKGQMGEDVFIKELIPHIDATYRTIAKREGRALEGFSQGGRGTARIMFRHPHLFVSAAPGGGGHATEKRISEEGGRESDKLIFAKGDNTWDLARKYGARQNPGLNILVYVGNKGFNYQNNLEWMKHLKKLKITFQKIIIADAPHSATIIYEKRGIEIMGFHARNFKEALLK